MTQRADDDTCQTPFQYIKYIDPSTEDADSALTSKDYEVDIFNILDAALLVMKKNKINKINKNKNKTF